jgi:choline dehydrogenase-like flavoprotein
MRFHGTRWKGEGMTAPHPLAGLRDSLYDLSTLHTDITETCDAVIVGSGAGGAVLAKELAEGGMRVALVEEGGLHLDHTELAAHSFARKYRNAGLYNTFGNPMIAVPLGRCLGGTTAINSGTCFRTPPQVLDRWRREFGLEDIDDAAMDRAFNRVERQLGVAPADFRVMSRSNTMIHEFLAEEGESGAPLRRNAPRCEGCGMCCYGCTSHAKQSMDCSYLPAAVRAGAVVYYHAKATRIRRGRRNTVTGIHARAVNNAGRMTGQRLELRAPIVVLACGAFMTPQLLRANRIARRNPHLGRHLTLHPASKVAAEFPEPVNGWQGIPQAYGYEGLHNEGIMFEGASMPPDIGPQALPFSGEMLAQYIRRFRYMAMYGFMISDTAEGEMAYNPFLGHYFRYDLTALDLERIRRAAAWLARLYFRHGAICVYPMITLPGGVFKNLDDVARFEESILNPEDVEVMAFHPLGTCRLSDSPENGVCDARHQVHGFPGLYVCDGSAVPTPLGVNPQETIMALANRLAELLLKTELE